MNDPRLDEIFPTGYRIKEYRSRESNESMFELEDNLTETSWGQGSTEEACILDTLEIYARRYRAKYPPGTPEHDIRGFEPK